MNIIEKRDYIHSHLHQIDEKTINELYQKLQSGEMLKQKLTSRALKSEDDIKEGRVFSRSELEQKLVK